jgi:hypothetical protein
MQETWIAIILLTTQLTGYGLVGGEFDTQEKCWEYYMNHPQMQRINSDIPTSRPVMLFEIQTMGLGWITCERRYKLNGNIINKPLTNVLLPPPIGK